MILYCDTSALIRRYVEEDGTKAVDKLWDESSGIATSIVAFAETMAVLGRRRREGVLSAKEHRETVEAFKRDFISFILVPVTQSLNQSIEDILSRHSLRGFDAIHLASAVIFTGLKNNRVRFACFDRNLNNAAIEEGLTVVVKA